MLSWHAFLPISSLGLVSLLGRTCHTRHLCLLAYKDGKLDDFKVRKIKPTESRDFQKLHPPPRVYDVEIEVVGCCETSSLGASKEFKHFDASLHKGKVHFPWLSTGSEIVFAGIKLAFHALALDECRVHSPRRCGTCQTILQTPILCTLSV